MSKTRKAYFDEKHKYFFKFILMVIFFSVRKLFLNWVGGRQRRDGNS